MATTTIDIKDEETKKHKKPSQSEAFNDSMKGILHGKNPEDLSITGNPYTSSSNDQNQKKAKISKKN